MDILRKEREESPTGNMLYDFFYFLKLFERSTRALDANQIKWYLGSCEVTRKTEMLTGKLDKLFISPSPTIKISPKKENYWICKSIREFRI